VFGILRLAENLTQAKGALLKNASLADPAHTNQKSTFGMTKEIQNETPVLNEQCNIS